ncbi:hypothetical protein [Hymenobacter rubidus]|uniref:hypothetical protein n=1 Tax=Hymenobacter rubidus TaxID=1441626 RepID=UPI00191FCB87|nr:hypothetical protein [Hymenobacter rubidus]
MSTEKLAFLQNFYTDVTLYMPAEPAEAPAEPARATAAAPVAKPLPTPPEKPQPPVAEKPTPLRPIEEFSRPSMAFSKPSAGLERLATAAHHPVPAASPAPAAATPPVSPVVQPLAAPAVPPVLLTPFTVMGDNAQGVVLLFRLPTEEFRKLHRNVFLNKMLQALNLVMADVVLVNVDSELPVALVNLRKALAATHIIAFGKNLLDTTIRNTQIYEPVQFPSLGLSYLSSATVDLVEYDVSLKKRLWPGLQRMFRS